MEENEVRRLAKKALRGLLRQQILVALLLFLPAWSVQYWEGWLYWCLLGGFSLGITLHFLRHDPSLIVRRLEVGPGAEQEKSQRVIQTVASILLFGLLIIPALDHRQHWSQVPVWAVLAADGAVATGFLIGFLVFRENSHAAGTVKVEADQTVITTGPYRIVRHPFYASATLMFLATPFALGSVWGLSAAIPLCVVIVIRLLHEEQFLLARLPGYSDYCLQVRSRLIPMIW
jgi:protein-S-isoprenylcysteine O-methyltransferase Ste14